MEQGLRSGVWVIATGVIVTGLYFGRDIIAPFALAVFLWLIMEGFTRRIEEFVFFSPKWLARVISILLVVGGFGLVLVMLAQGVEQIGDRAGEYENKINALISDVYGLVRLPNAPSLAEILFDTQGQRFLGALASVTGDLSENLLLVLIYVGFLYLAQSNWSTKLDVIFRDADNRERARTIGTDARKGIETYLWTQTVISALITALTYVTLLLLGLESVMLLCVLIFVLNYIPTIGSIIAAFVPALFALVQPDWPGYMPENTYINAALVLAGVSFWQFSIGNFVQPRLMGETLNLSSLVVLLSLAIWGALWGIPGMFLSAPLTVLMMITLQEISETKWIAVLLSADGNPGKR